MSAKRLLQLRIMLCQSFSYQSIHRKCSSSNTFNNGGVAESSLKSKIEILDFQALKWLQDLSPEEPLILSGQKNSQPLKEMRNGDPVIALITAAESAEEVFTSAVSGEYSELHAAAAVRRLWELTHLSSSTSLTRHTAQHERIAALVKYVQVVRERKEFLQLVCRVDDGAAHLPDSTISQVLLCLRKFGVEPWNPSVHQLLTESKRRLPRMKLPVLAKWCLAVRDTTHSGRLLSPASLPLIHLYLQQCSTVEELKLLSVCFLSVTHLQTLPLACLYNNAVERLLDSGQLNESSDVTTLVQVLQGLHHSSHLTPATDLILGLLQLLSEKQLDSSRTVFWANKMLLGLMEPVDLANRLEKRACRLLNEAIHLGLEHLELLMCLSPVMDGDRKKRLEHLLNRLLHSQQVNVIEPFLNNIYQSIRHLKLDSKPLLDLFWETVVKCVSKSSGSRPPSRIVDSSSGDSLVSNWWLSMESNNLLYRAVYWYMYFELKTGVPRNPSFEKQMLAWIDEMWPRSAALHVRFFCRMLAFQLAYSRQSTRLEPDVLDKLTERQSQMDAADVEILSRAVKLVHATAKKRPLAESVVLLKVALILDAVSLRCLTKSKLLFTTTSLLKASNERKSSINNRDALDLIGAIIRRCEEQLEQLNGRIIRDLSSSLLLNKFLSVKVIDAMVDYAIRHHQRLLPDVLCRLMLLCYEMAYPDDGKGFWTIISTTIHGQTNRLHGLQKISCALALLLHHQLPIEWVRDIFSVPFLDTLDHEIATCVSKNSYPVQVRQKLMELNRAVCIDMPEADIPWFHDKYCSQQIMLHPPVWTSFHADVLACLDRLMDRGTISAEDRQVQSLTFSPYYHLIDFLLGFDKDKLVANVDSSDSQVDKIALILWLPNAFTVHQRNLTGSEQLRARHLEMLGYNVVGVAYHQWNSLPLSNMDAKCNFLTKKLTLYRNLP